METQTVICPHCNEGFDLYVVNWSRQNEIVVDEVETEAQHCVVRKATGRIRVIHDGCTNPPGDTWAQPVLA